MNIDDFAKDLGINKDIVKTSVEQLVLEMQREQYEAPIKKLKRIKEFVEDMPIIKEEYLYKTIENVTVQQCLEVLYNIQELINSNRFYF